MPERTYATFILAVTAYAIGLDAAIYFVMKGTAVVKKGEAEKAKLVKFSTLR